MLTKDQRTRLLKVLTLPILIVSSWLADTGYTHFYPLEFSGICNQSGECHQISESYAQATAFHYSGGIWVERCCTRGYSGHRLTGDLIAKTIDFQDKSEKTIALAGTTAEQYSVLSCRLSSIMPSPPKEHKEIFTLDCPNKPTQFFYFKDQHQGLGISEAIKNAKLQHDQFSEKVNSIKIAAFFTPTVIIFLIWLTIKLIKSTYLYIRYGKQNKN